MKRFLLVFLIVLTLAVICAPCVSALSLYGSRGNEVTEIQRELSSRGYYNGSIDGIYGKLTENAVRLFQKANGLKVDGIAGTQTLSALGITEESGDIGSADYRLLARIISAEARGEPYIGQVAVGAVVLNRIEHPSFPDTMAGVVYQKGAFSCLTDGQFDKPIANSAYSAARDALNGMDPSDGAIYYFNPDTATSSWIWSRPHIVTIGSHRFCG
ncbi:MAG: spore cortex-lytic enzyme [Clostridia bacterium]|nr:spore cortex-lytic enzyme [Clostridia bacterium]